MRRTPRRPSVWWTAVGGALIAVGIAAGLPLLTVAGVTANVTFLVRRARHRRAVS